MSQTVGLSYSDTNSEKTKGMEQFFGALSDLSCGCDFGPKEESIVGDLFIFNMRNEESC